MRKTFSLNNVHAQIKHDGMLFNVPNISSLVVCKLNIYSINTIADFIVAMQRVFKLSTTRAHIDRTVASLIVLHFCLYAVLTSNFVKFVYQNNRYITIPSFVQPLLIKISTPVESRSKESGWIKGRTESAVSIPDSFATLKTLDEDTLCGIAIRGGFSVYESNSSKRSLFKDFTYLVSTIDGSTETEIFENVLSFFQTLPNISYSDSIPFFSGLHPISISKEFGVYRFRENTLNSGYNTTQASFHGLDVGLKNLFACFLGLYKPKFYTDTGHLISSDFLPGDCLISSENISNVDMFVFLLSAVPIRTRQQNFKSSKKSSSHNNPLSGLTSTESMNDDSLSRSFSSVRSSSSDLDLNNSFIPGELVFHKSDTAGSLCWVYYNQSSPLFTHIPYQCLLRYETI
jgi:hypothetical protein